LGVETRKPATGEEKACEVADGLMSKEELEAAIKAANLWSGRSTLVLAIGILGEYVLLPFLEKGRWKTPVKIFFAVLVVAGIAGEYEFSSKIAQHADELQRLSDHELADAIGKAKTAIEHASTAEQGAGEAKVRASKNEEEAARLRLRSAELEASNLRTERKLALLSARYNLIRKGQADFLKATEPFRGQKVELQLCRGLEADNETGALYQSILELLTSAKWETRGALWQTCLTGTGVRVSVNVGSSAATMEAANSLGKVLDKLLRGDFDPKEFNALSKLRESDKFKPWAWISPVFDRDTPLAAETIRIAIFGHQPQ
jgi:hypothetical protein